MQLFPNTRIPPRLQQFSCTCHSRIRRQKSLYKCCKGTGEKEASASPLFSLDRLLSVDISSFNSRLFDLLDYNCSTLLWSILFLWHQLWLGLGSSALATCGSRAEFGWKGIETVSGTLFLGLNTTRKRNRKKKSLFGVTVPKGLT